MFNLPIFQDVNYNQYFRACLQRFPIFMDKEIVLLSFLEMIIYFLSALWDQQTTVQLSRYFSEAFQ